jgi:N-acetylglutamate synthase-like GNAT family acetyltransferase
MPAFLRIASIRKRVNFIDLIIYNRMKIRKAHVSDCTAIQALLRQLGYPDTEQFLLTKLERMLTDPGEVMLVYELDSKVVAFISVHFIPQIALQGDFARISYFAVMDETRGKGIGAEMEKYITTLAKEKNCDRIEVHCHSRRSDAHRFYLRHGFKEAPKYFIKPLSAE